MTHKIYSFFQQKPQINTNNSSSSIWLGELFTYFPEPQKTEKILVFVCVIPCGLVLLLIHLHVLTDYVTACLDVDSDGTVCLHCAHPGLYLVRPE